MRSRGAWCWIGAASVIASRCACYVIRQSHELRTPLASIFGHAGLIFDDPPSAETVARSARVIELGVKHPMSLVDNVLDQASMEAGQLTLNPVPTRLAPDTIITDLYLNDHLHRKETTQ